MKQYINKSAAVAEFNRLIAELVEGEVTMFEQGRISAFENAKKGSDDNPKKQKVTSV